MCGESMTDEYEEIKSEETRKNLNVFRPIDKTASYDPKTFVGAQSKIKDLEEYLQRLNQPNGHAADVGARRDLSYLLYGDQNEQLSRTDTQLMSEADDAYRFAIENMSRYIENNRGRVISEFDGKSLMSLVINKLPLYLTKKKNHDGSPNEHYDAKHNKLVADILEFRAMKSSDEKTRGEAQESLMKKIMDDKEVPEWIKVSMQREAGRGQSFERMIFIKYAAGQTNALLRYLTNGDKPDESKLKELINNSLRVAYDRYDDIPSGKAFDKERREDVWEKSLRECYMVMARELRSVEKKELEDDNPEKREENEREDERKSLRMAA
jgi:hypothetical protein